MKDLIACPRLARREGIFTTVVGGTHGIWPPIYDLSSGAGDIYAWLLTQANP